MRLPCCVFLPDDSMMVCLVLLVCNGIVGRMLDSLCFRLSALLMNRQLRDGLLGFL